MITRYASSLLILGLVAVAPRLSTAMDADTARMEAANLCTAMPYTCSAVVPPVAAPVERKTPKPSQVRQQARVVPMEHHTAPVATLPTPPPFTPLETVGMLACLNAAVNGASSITPTHILLASSCFSIIHPGRLR